MKAYLIRHADAVSGQVRFLSLEGRKRARRVGSKLKADGVVFDALITSPLLRAAQTAEIIAAELDYSGLVEGVTALAPDAGHRLTLAELESRGHSVGVVGHEPAISELAATLLGKSLPAFNNAQVTLIEKGKLVWTLDPTLLEKG